MDEVKAGMGKPLPHRLIVAAELELMKSGGIIEVACRNPNVLDYMQHWEGRTEKAESALSEAQATIARQQVMLDRALESNGDMMVRIGKLEALIAQEAEFLQVVQAKKDEYIMALASIRDNTCCDGCREAARVARAALAQGKGE